MVCYEVVNLGLLSWKWQLSRFRCSVTGVNKLLLQFAKVNGLVKYSAVELVLGQSIAVRPVHSGIQQNAESTGIILNWDAIYFFGAPMFQRFTKFRGLFSCFIFVTGCFPPPLFLLKMNWNEYGLNVRFSIFVGSKGLFFQHHVQGFWRQYIPAW